MTYPAIVFLALLLWSFSWSKEGQVYLLFGSSAFASLAVLPPALAAGATLLPSSLTALALIGRYSLDPQFRKTLLRDAFAPNRMGLFTAFMIVAVLGAAFLPRLFAGQVEVIAMRMAIRSPTELLQPSGANITQLAYLCLTYGLSLCLYTNLSNRKFVTALLNSFVLGGAILILSGVADMALGGKGSAILAPFKTAQYAFMEDNVVMGARRIIGLMSEASAYGGTCVSFAAMILLTYPAIEDRKVRLAAILVGAGCVVMGGLSTSSTAIVGVAVLAACYLANFARRLWETIHFGDSRARRTITNELTALCLLLFLGAIGAALLPGIVELLIKFVDGLVFHKTATSSYAERMNWNRMALQALVGTHGLGVGVGSARASNWVVSIFSNAGVLGGALLFSFIGLNMLRPIRSRQSFNREAVIGARFAVLVSLAMVTLSGTTPDMGLAVGALLALTCALAPVRDEQAKQSRPRRQALNRRLGGYRTPVNPAPGGTHGGMAAPEPQASGLRRWRRMVASPTKPSAPNA